jgi:hypothetical protein
MELSPSWEAVNCAATQEIPSILWNPKVHNPVHKSPLLSLFWARSIQSIPSHSISLRFILILSTHLRLGLPSGIFPYGIPTNILHAFLCPHSCYMPCPSHPQPPVTSSLFGPNILLSTLFSNTCSLCSSLNVRDQVLHPYRITGKSIVLYMLRITTL